MKLYFYILENNLSKDAKLKKTVCEMEEKPKTYQFKEPIPEYYHNASVSKSEIGKVNKHGDAVVLLEDDAAQAKHIFGEYYRSQISQLEKRIVCMCNKLDIIATAEGV